MEKLALRALLLLTGIAAVWCASITRPSKDTAKTLDLDQLLDLKHKKPAADSQQPDRTSAGTFTNGKVAETVPITTLYQYSDQIVKGLPLDQFNKVMKNPLELKGDPKFIQSSVVAFYFYGDGDFVVIRINEDSPSLYYAVINKAAAGLMRVVEDSGQPDISYTVDLNGDYPTVDDCKFKLYEYSYTTGGNLMVIMLFESVAYDGHFLRWFGNGTVNCMPNESETPQSNQYFYWVLVESPTDDQPFAVRLTTMDHKYLQFYTQNSSPFI